MIYSIFGIVLVGTMEFTSTFGSERAAKILEMGPTENTIAIVTKIDSRNSRGGSQLWAILSYHTKTANITQAVYNYTGKYSVGQKYLVRYSIDNPEMFQIIERKE